MFKQLAVAAAAVLSLSSALAGTGSVNGTLTGNDGSPFNPYQLGTIGSTPTDLTATVLPDMWNSPIEEYAEFTIAAPSQVSFTGMAVSGIDNLWFRVFADPLPNNTGLVATLAGDGLATTFSVAAAGTYHLYITGDFNAGVSTGQYALSMNTVPVPEPESYALMLAGLGAVGFLARRRRPAA